MTTVHMNLRARINLPYKAVSARKQFSSCKSRKAIKVFNMNLQRLDKETHNERQASTFNNPEIVKEFTRVIPTEVEQRLQTIVNSVPGLGPESRVVDVGCGTGCLIPALRKAGVKDILAVDLSEAMLSVLQKRYGVNSILGNDLGVRTWRGDIMDLPLYMAPLDAVYLNNVFGNLHAPRNTLMKAAIILRPGGYVVISNPMGRKWHQMLHEERPDVIPHSLPDIKSLNALTRDLPLRITSFTDTDKLFLAVLQVPPKYAFPQAPLVLEGPVVTGYGRGGKELGMPTANLDPKAVLDKLANLPLGVYFGWAQLEGRPGAPREDQAVHKMVMNVGMRPTVADSKDVSVEVHMLHKFSTDFYGSKVKCVVTGYIRPEMKFANLNDLILRIKMDVALARTQLDSPKLISVKGTPVFTFA